MPRNADTDPLDVPPLSDPRYWPGELAPWLPRPRPAPPVERIDDSMRAVLDDLAIAEIERHQRHER